MLGLGAAAAAGLLSRSIWKKRKKQIKTEPSPQALENYALQIEEDTPFNEIKSFWKNQDNNNKGKKKLSWKTHRGDGAFPSLLQQRNPFRKRSKISRRKKSNRMGRKKIGKSRKFNSGISR
tara:strand:- start:382 stop:744 length:363 start_codon:yes stop_codon:yes gene_type:complete